MVVLGAVKVHISLGVDLVVHLWGWPTVFQEILWVVQSTRWVFTQSPTSRVEVICLSVRRLTSSLHGTQTMPSRSRPQLTPFQVRLL